MPTTTWQDILIDAALARGLHISKEDIEPINTQADTSALAQWTDRNVIQTSLLSKEELSIWEYSIKHKRQISNSEVIAKGMHTPASEADIEETIAALETSTQALDLQSRVISSQQSLLTSRTNSQTTSRFESSLARRKQTEIQQLKLLNEELPSELWSNLRASQDRIDRSSRAISSIVTERLNSDDRTIEKLEDTLGRIDTDTSFDIAAHVERIRVLTRALQKTTTLSLKHHLDRLYLEHLHTSTLEHSSEGNETDDNPLHVKQLRDDLQLLYAEIDDVAGLLVHHDHGAVIDDLILRISWAQSQQAVRDATSVRTKLESMTQALKDLTNHCNMLQSHRIIMQQLKQSLDKVQIPCSNFDARIKPDKSGRVQESQAHALEAVLQHLNIDIDQNTNKSKNRQYHKASTISLDIQKETNDKIQQLQDFLAQTLTERQKSLQPFTDGLETNNGHGSGELTEIHRQISDIDRRVAACKADVEAAAGNDISSDVLLSDFIQKWGHRGDG